MIIVYCFMGLILAYIGALIGREIHDKHNYVDCDFCSGTGNAHYLIHGEDFRECPQCHGIGVLERRYAEWLSGGKRIMDFINESSYSVSTLSGKIGVSHDDIAKAIHGKSDPEEILSLIAKL